MKKERQTLRVADIAKSLAGHDKGKYYVVVAELGEDFVLVCDGERRKRDDPKTKRRKHLAFVAKAGMAGKTDDAAIAEAIRRYRNQED